ncbi:MAG: transposase [Oscillospiraceae bacterium]|nr:transposase [Oscillospiraceae bacterium]
MMSDAQFEYMTDLQYTNKHLKRRIKEFESGEKYTSMRAEHKRQLAAKDRENKKLKLQLAVAERAIIDNRNSWILTIEESGRAHAKEMRAKDARIKELYERSLKYERLYCDLLDIVKEMRSELYAVKTELEDEKEKAVRLVAQLKRDHENSSIPSSEKVNRKKITNSRESSGKKPGAQPGHKGHSRKRHEPTNIIEVPPPAEFVDNPDYYPTGNIIVKQLVNIEMKIIIDEYRTPEYRHRLSRCIVYAKLPDGVVNDVNYGGSVKAFAFLLNNHCNVSIDKTRTFLSDLTGGILEISNGMINGLSKEFSMKTQDAQNDVFSKLLCVPVMGTDYTSVRVNGKLAQVLVCAAGDVAMYNASEHKGHEGLKGTPVEHYLGTLLHDHDKTFYSYGKWHQECLAHILRYLIASMEYELNLTWSRLMWELVREMIHYRNSLGEEDDIDVETVEHFVERYLTILETARNEYEYEPPGKYYKDGYNLYKRMLKYKDSHLLFLHDKNVPTNNNHCERLLRILKRKAKQVMSFRSFEGLKYLCICLGILAQLKSGEENLYSSVTAIFE